MNSDCAESDGGSLAFAFRSLRFLLASQIIFDSNYAAPLLIRQRHFVRSCDNDVLCDTIGRTPNGAIIYLRMLMKLI